jgi:hypothetical protein
MSFLTFCKRLFVFPVRPPSEPLIIEITGGRDSTADSEFITFMSVNGFLKESTKF